MVGPLSLTVLMISADEKQHLKKKNVMPEIPFPATVRAPCREIGSQLPIEPIHAAAKNEYVF